MLHPFSLHFEHPVADCVPAAADAQYIARDAVRPEVIVFSMGFAASRR